MHEIQQREKKGEKERRKTNPDTLPHPTSLIAFLLNPKVLLHNRFLIAYSMLTLNDGSSLNITTSLTTSPFSSNTLLDGKDSHSRGSHSGQISSEHAPIPLPLHNPTCVSTIRTNTHPGPSLSPPISKPPDTTPGLQITIFVLCATTALFIAHTQWHTAERTPGLDGKQGRRELEGGLSLAEERVGLRGGGGAG